MAEQPDNLPIFLFHLYRWDGTTPQQFRDHYLNHHFEIGKRNLLTLRKLLWKNGVIIRAEDTGGQRQSRTLALRVGSGEVVVKANGRELPL